MIRVTCDPYRGREVQGHGIRWSMMSHITDMRNDLQSEGAGWLFKSSLAGAGALCQPHYRPHSLFVIIFFGPPAQSL